MKHFLRLAALLACLIAPSAADAATCFWVGGTASADSVNVASWASSTGGTPSTCAATGGIPKNAGDIATFDASSGGGTITVCGALSLTCPSGTGSWSLAQITMGAFTGTLDFSAINPNVTLTTAFSGTGSGTRTLNMGSGTWTLSAGIGTIWDCTSCGASLTLNAGTSTILLSATTVTGARTLAVGTTKTYATITINSPTTFTTDSPVLFGSSLTIGTLNINPSIWLRLTGGTTTTITNAFNWLGTAFDASIVLDGGTGTTATISSANNGTIAWATIMGLTFSGGGTFTATNSFNMKGTSGINITGPSTGGGGRIIGG